MSPLISNVSFILGLLTIIAQALVAVILVSLGYRAMTGRESAFIRALSPHVLPLSFAVALVATLGSLFYSQIAHFTPCELCWFQRIFMYPQAVILGIALFTKDSSARRYSLALSGIGAAIGAYQNYLIYGGPAFAACSAAAGAASCTTRFIVEFGYITIPMMAFSAFALIIALMLIPKRRMA